MPTSIGSSTMGANNIYSSSSANGSVVTTGRQNPFSKKSLSQSRGNSYFDNLIRNDRRRSSSSSDIVTLAGGQQAVESNSSVSSPNPKKRVKLKIELLKLAINHQIEEIKAKKQFKRSDKAQLEALRKVDKEQLVQRVEEKLKSMSDETKVLWAEVEITTRFEEKRQNNRLYRDRRSDLSKDGESFVARGARMFLSADNIVKNLGEKDREQLARAALKESAHKELMQQNKNQLAELAQEETFNFLQRRLTLGAAVTTAKEAQTMKKSAHRYVKELESANHEKEISKLAGQQLARRSKAYLKMMKKGQLQQTIDLQRRYGAIISTL